MMKPSKLHIKEDQSILSWIIDQNRLIIMKNSVILYEINCKDIENIKVERKINHDLDRTYVVIIQGNFMEYAKIFLSYKNAFLVQSWLQKVMGRFNNILTIDTSIRYRPKFLKPDWKEVLGSYLSVALILFLLAYIFFVGIPALRNDRQKEEKTLQNFQYFLEEGKRLIELDRLSEGIDNLEEAKLIKNTSEVQTILDAAYFERAEFYYQNKDYKKSLADLKLMKQPSAKSEKLLEKVEVKVNNSPYFVLLNIEEIMEISKNQWDIHWIKTTVKDIQWDGKKYDSEKGIIFSCMVTGKDENNLNKIVIKTEMMLKDELANYPSFELTSQEFLSSFLQLPFLKENRAKILQWFTEWYPKATASNLRARKQFAAIAFELLGEKGIRSFEIKVIEEQSKVK